jgi:hypothetical protein
VTTMQTADAHRFELPDGVTRQSVTYRKRYGIKLSADL